MIKYIEGVNNYYQGRFLSSHLKYKNYRWYFFISDDFFKMLKFMILNFIYIVRKGNLIKISCRFFLYNTSKIHQKIKYINNMLLLFIYIIKFYTIFLPGLVFIVHWSNVRKLRKVILIRLMLLVSRFRLPVRYHRIQGSSLLLISRLVRQAVIQWYMN